MISQRRHAHRLIGLTGFALLGCATAAIALTTREHAISQRGKTFFPNEIVITPGDSLAFVNDDRIVHHAYSENGQFDFDTGDQDPDSRSSVVFLSRGTFTVLCGIHPKMKLQVRVD